MLPKSSKWTFISIALSLLLLTLATSSFCAWQQQVTAVPSQTKETENRERYQKATDVLTGWNCPKAVRLLMLIHEIDPELVRKELGQVGFQVVKSEDPFLKRMPEVTNGDRIATSDMWLMVAIRPK
jgi:hypothetical protein